MRLSRLQKNIITGIFLGGQRPKTPADFFLFYSEAELKKNKKTIGDTIHNSLENLVAKDLLVAYGRKTAQKWYIDKVKLTSSGRKLARDFIERKQPKLI
jgi:hypothetical protein